MERRRFSLTTTSELVLNNDHVTASNLASALGSANVIRKRPAALVPVLALRAGDARFKVDQNLQSAPCLSRLAEGMTGMRLCDTQGRTGADAHPAYPGRGDEIPGHLAPDGVTVLSLDWVEANQIVRVSATRGPDAHEVFNRRYRTPGTGGFPFLQADPLGRVYVLVNGPDANSLLCLDGKSGDPVGRVKIDMRSEAGELRQPYVVVPTGGVVVQRATKAAVFYDWYEPGALRTVRLARPDGFTRRPSRCSIGARLAGATLHLRGVMAP